MNLLPLVVLAANTAAADPLPMPPPPRMYGPVLPRTDDLGAPPELASDVGAVPRAVRAPAVAEAPSVRPPVGSATGGSWRQADPAPAPSRPATPAPRASPALASEPELALPTATTSLLVPGLALGALGAAALLLRRRQTGALRFVHVMETVSLGPKRQLVVARMGEEVLLLGVSEGGVSVLRSQPATAEALAPTPVSERAAAPAGLLDAMRTAATSMARRPAAPAGEGLLGRLGLKRAQKPAFDTLLAETAEELELRRKLSVGAAARVGR